MCLGVPGKVVNIADDELRTAKVSFGGISKDVSLVYVPEAQIGDYVIVHVGFAIGRLDETEARKSFDYLDQLGELGEFRPEHPS
jgi:hydrogenase expression/formation protein HypC